MNTLLLSLLLVAAPLPPNGHVAKVRGLELFYRDLGAGPVVLLLHGGGGDSRRFDALAPELAKHHRVIVPDARGRGRSSDRDEPYHYATLADDVLALMDSLEISRASLAGWSDGGVTALELARRHPDRVERIAIFGANTSPDGLDAETVAWLAKLTPEAWPNPEYSEVARDPAHWKTVVARLKRLWRTEPRLSSAELAKISVPVLVAAGDHDEIRLAHTVALFEALPLGELLVMPQAGHSLKDQDLGLIVHSLERFFAPAQ